MGSDWLGVVRILIDTSFIQYFTVAGKVQLRKLLVSRDGSLDARAGFFTKFWGFTVTISLQSGASAGRPLRSPLLKANRNGPALIIDPKSVPGV